MNTFNFQIRPLDETQRILAQTVATTLGRLAPLRAGRPTVVEGEFDLAWGELVGLSLQEMLVPEAAGGLGLGAVEAIATSYYSGSACSPFPLKEMIWAHGLCASGGAMSRSAHALSARSLAVSSPLRPTSRGLASSNDGVRTVASAVCPPGQPDQLLLICRDANDDRNFAIVVRLDSPGVSVIAQGTIDLRWRSIEVDLPRELLDAHGVFVASSAIDRYRQLWSIMCAAEVLGAAHSALSMGLTHLHQRVQFKQPIGSRQALQHLVVDDHVLCENLMLAVEVAALAWDSGSEDEIEQAVAIAVLQARRARRVLENAIQFHGAMGFTCEIPLHHLMRRVIRLGSELWEAAEPSEVLGRSLSRVAQRHHACGAA